MDIKKKIETIKEMAASWYKMHNEFADIVTKHDIKDISIITDDIPTYLRAHWDDLYVRKTLNLSKKHNEEIAKIIKSMSFNEEIIRNVITEVCLLGEIDTLADEKKKHILNIKFAIDKSDILAVEDICDYYLAIQPSVPCVIY